MTDATERELQQRLKAMGFHPDANEHELLDYIQDIMSYVQHTEECEKTIIHYSLDPVCDCGLNELLSNSK